MAPPKRNLPRFPNAKSLLFRYFAVRQICQFAMKNPYCAVRLLCTFATHSKYYIIPLLYRYCAAFQIYQLAMPLPYTFAGHTCIVPYRYNATIVPFDKYVN